MKKSRDIEKEKKMTFFMFIVLTILATWFITMLVSCTPKDITQQYVDVAYVHWEIECGGGVIHIQRLENNVWINDTTFIIKNEKGVTIKKGIDTLRLYDNPFRRMIVVLDNEEFYSDRTYAKQK